MMTVLETEEKVSPTQLGVFYVCMQSVLFAWSIVFYLLALDLQSNQGSHNKLLACVTHVAQH